MMHLEYTLRGPPNVSSNKINSIRKIEKKRKELRRKRRRRVAENILVTPQH